MRVLCIAETTFNEIYPHMLKAAEKFGASSDITGGFYDNSGYEELAEYVMKMEKKGPEGEPVPEFFKENKDAQIVIACFCPITEEGLDELENVRVIGSIRSGCQNVNVEAATKKGIAVFRVPGRNAQSVSDYTIALMLAEARELVRNSKIIMSGNWIDPTIKTHYQPELHDKTVGIVGLGAIGCLVAKKLRDGFDMNVLAYDPYVSDEQAEEMGITKTDLKTLFRNSDFVTLHAKATDETKGMITRELLESMKDTAILVNTARASLIDSKALYDVLKQKKIAGAALDVLDEEPVTKDNPFLSLENVTITGHQAGNSSDTVANSPGLLADEIEAMIKGESVKGLVNSEVLENEAFKEWLKEAKREITQY